VPTSDVSVFWLRAAALCYLPGLVYAAGLGLRRSLVSFRLAQLVFAIGAVLHLVSLVDLARAVGHFPADNVYESVSLCALLLAALFLFVHWRYRFESLAMVIFPLVLVLTAVAGFGGMPATWGNPRVRDAWLILHVTLAIAGYATLLVAAGASVFYLVQERRLKLKVISSQLPPLATLDQVLSRAMAIGFVLITLAVVMGSIWGFVETGTSWVAEPKIVVAWATWLGYLLMLYLRVGAGWRGRKAAMMALSVLGFSALTWAAHIGVRAELTR
jgi:ABC-type transport system involved in cytochrome c biogenesis permease subunit